jgi:hypothetical protein
MFEEEYDLCFGLSQHRKVLTNFPNLRSLSLLPKDAFDTFHGASRTHDVSLRRVVFPNYIASNLSRFAGQTSFPSVRYVLK